MINIHIFIPYKQVISNSYVYCKNVIISYSYENVNNGMHIHTC